MLQSAFRISWTAIANFSAFWRENGQLDDTAAAATAQTFTGNEWAASSRTVFQASLQDDVAEVPKESGVSIPYPSKSTITSVTAMVARCLPQQTLKLLSSAPPTANEVAGVSLSLQAQPEKCLHMLPAGATRKTIADIMAGVQDVLHDTEFVLSTARMIKEQEHSNALHTYRGDTTEWEHIYDEFPCAICMDVLAAPVLLTPCSHTFCGACIQQLHRAGSSSCPQCKTHFNFATDVHFVRLLDNCILKLVQGTDSPSKAEWAKHREAFRHPPPLPTGWTADEWVVAVAAMTALTIALIVAARVVRIT